MTFPTFRTGVRKLPTSSTFEVQILPDHERERLCRDLIAEFGAQVVRSTRDGELIHSCPIPGAGHKNGDRNASASLNWKKLAFNCFGCGSRGGLLWFMAVCRGEDTQQVREWLERSTGTGGQTMDAGKVLELIDALTAPKAPPEPIPRYADAVLDPWEYVHPYMTEIRGVPEETLDRFRVCYAEKYPMGPGKPPQPRIIIPLYWDGELVGWQARAILRRDEPKYKNTPSFPRDRLLYGYHRHRHAVVVESPLSVLRHHHHMPELIATFGAEVTEEQARLLHRFDRVTLWFDNDNGGYRGTRHLAEQLERYTQVRVVPSPYDADLADMDDDLADRLLAEAVPYPLWDPPQSLLPLEG